MITAFASAVGLVFSCAVFVYAAPIGSDDSDWLDSGSACLTTTAACDIGIKGR